MKSTKADFDKATSTSRLFNEVQRDLRRDLNDYLNKADSILNRMPNPTKETFIRAFKSNTDLFTMGKTSVKFFFDSRMAAALDEGRIGTYKYYKECFGSLQSYKKDLFFEVITEKWLKSYMSFMRANGNSPATIALRLRCLKIMFNDAIKEGFIPANLYPFKNISTGCSIKSKSVLYPDQLKALWFYESKGIREGRALAYFFFCYLANGMNFKDMAYLKWKNIKGDTFTFIREKTKATSREAKEVRVFVNDYMKRIIEMWGNQLKNPEDYVFPILTGSADLMHMETKRLRCRRECNKMLSRIGKELGFDVPINLGIARHSFATSLKLSGTPVEFISDAMGHSNSIVTQHYLKSIPDKQLEIMSNKLLAFGGQPDLEIS